MTQARVDAEPVTRSNTSQMTRQEWITEALEQGLSPATLAVTDESHLHAGHAGARPEGETHFRVDVVSAAFEGKGRVERHRMVNALLAEAFSSGLHALAVAARTPAEANAARGTGTR
jgi:BolA family transcriptional regulator, general stress-responsive regulator